MKTIISLCILCIMHNSYGQAYVQNVVSAGGGTASYSGTTFDWTLGEIAIETISSSETLYTQGFLQPSIKPLVETATKLVADKISVMPNPVSNELSIVFLLPNNKKMLINITDAAGRKMFSEEQVPQTGSIKINTARLHPGVYFLTVTDVNFTNHSFKINKL